MYLNAVQTIKMSSASSSSLLKLKPNMSGSRGGGEHGSRRAARSRGLEDTIIEELEAHASPSALSAWTASGKIFQGSACLLWHDRKRFSGGVKANLRSLIFEDGRRPWRVAKQRD